VSWALASELVEVLRRPEIRRYGIDEKDVAAVLAVLGPFLPDVDVVVDVRDPDDAPVVAAALAGRADAIVTGDRDLLEDAALSSWLDDRGVRVLSPAEVLSELQPSEGR
jgi:putative PIN family toxin of toxin-antitoxin system